MPSIHGRMTALESLTTENNKTLHRQRKVDWQWLVTTLIALAAVLAVFLR